MFNLNDALQVANFANSLLNNQPNNNTNPLVDAVLPGKGNPLSMVGRAIGAAIEDAMYEDEQERTERLKKEKEEEQKKQAKLAQEKEQDRIEQNKLMTAEELNQEEQRENFFTQKELDKFRDNATVINLETNAEKRTFALVGLLLAVTERVSSADRDMANTYEENAVHAEIAELASTLLGKIDASQSQHDESRYMNARVASARSQVMQGEEIVITNGNPSFGVTLPPGKWIFDKVLLTDPQQGHILASGTYCYEEDNGTFSCTNLKGTLGDAQYTLKTDDRTRLENVKLKGARA